MKIKLTLDESDSKFKGSWSNNDNGKLQPLSDTLSVPDVTNIFIEKNPPSGFLPAAVRWISMDGRFVIFERPPHYREIKIARGLYASGARVERYRVPIPWTLYSFKWEKQSGISNLHVFQTQGPVTDLNTLLFMLPILNLDQWGMLCTPKALGLKLNDLGSAVNEAYSMFWNSTFNLDLQTGFTQYYRTIVSRQGYCIPRERTSPAEKSSDYVPYDEKGKLIFPSFQRKEIGESFYATRNASDAVRAQMSNWIGCTLEEVVESQKVGWTCNNYDTLPSKLTTKIRSKEYYTRIGEYFYTPSIFTDELVKELGLKSKAKSETTRYNSVYSLLHLIINNDYNPVTAEPTTPPSIVSKLKKLLIQMS